MFSLHSCFYLLFVVCLNVSYGPKAFSCSTTETLFRNSTYSFNDTIPVTDSLTDKIFEATELPAIPDTVAWRRHLQMGLRDVILSAGKAGMKIGKYTMQVRFVVEKDGSITNVQALDDPGYGTRKSVEKLIRKGPKWRPAEIAGQKVRSYRIQPVTFMILSNIN
jgi:periplasmic protein TonB